MVEYLINELSRRLEIEDMKFINWEKTRELQALPKFQNFHYWLKANGARYDSIEYPVCFGKSGGLIGIAAKRNIGPEESYIYIPTKLIINDDKVLNSAIGPIVKKHEDVFKEHPDGEYLRLIFFICYELHKDEESFWAPYFAIAQETDLPCFWDKKDIDELEDELLKAEIREYQDEYEAEFEVIKEIASMYPDIINMEKFTEKNFKLAFTITVTRCFGWSLPSTMVVPFADCANHFIIDNQYELFNSRLHGVQDTSTVSTDEQKYFTSTKMRINCYKHFKEDQDDSLFDNYELPYKTKRYIRKLKMRENCSKLTVQKFLDDSEYKDKEIWELKYISTSDEEDNDSSEEETESDDEEEEKKEKVDTVQKDGVKSIDNDSKNDTTKIWKDDSPGKLAKVPDIAKKLRPSKKKQRIYFTYSSENQEGQNSEPKKSVVVKKRVEGRQPESLIDLLVMQKQYMYEQEQRMKLLKEQDEDEWNKMTEEYNSSEEEDDEENFSWYKDNDDQTYFVLCTKHKNVYQKGQQVFHCYGRRTNRFLLLNYGFCLNNNKYNSLSFRVWINFDWQKERAKDQLKQQENQALYEPSHDDPEDEDENNRISKIIRLKKNRLNEEIFAYLRANLLNTYKGKNLEYLLVSSPVDAEFEMLVVACTINLLKGLMNSRFKTPIEVDQKLLEDPNMDYRKRFAILHRINAKEILGANIRLCEILMRILARLGDGRNFKQNYMRIVEDFETEDEIMPNRIKLRKYLRELVVNQKRVLEVALNNEYVQKVKSYFEEKQKEEEQRQQEMKEKQDDDEYYDEEEVEEEKKQ